MEHLPLTEIARFLNYKDLRSARRWCLLNGVSLLHDVGSRSYYAMETDFETARLKAFITDLKRRYGVDWLKAYQAHAEFNIELLSTLQETKRGNRTNKGKAFPIITTGKNEQRFLFELINLSTSH